MEYAIIMPSLWQYLSNEYNSSKVYFGLCVAGFHIGGLPSSSLMGVLNDWKFSVKSLVLFGNVIQIVGSCLYLVRHEKFVALSRFIVGFGAANSKLLTVDINRVTTNRGKTTIMSALMVCSTLGLFFGPAMNYFLIRFNLNIGTVRIDGYTAPGFIMAVTWSLYQLFMIITYYTPDEIELVNADETEVETARQSDAQDKIPLKDIGTTSSSSSSSSSSSTAQRDGLACLRVTLRRYYEELIVEGVVVCWAIFFLLYFLQSNMETAATPLMERFFHYGTFANSVAFGIMGMIGLSFSIFVGFLGKMEVDDRLIALTGLLLIMSSLVGAIAIFPGGKFGQKNLLVYYWVIVVLYCAGHPLLLISAWSLYSKIVNGESMGFAMGVAGSITFIGMILGPLWSGGMFDHLFIFYGVNLFLCLFVTSIFVLCYRHMKC